MDAETIIRGLKARYNLDDEAVVGVKGINCKEVDLFENGGNRDIEQVFNTDDVDLDDEVVLPAGLDISRYEANGRKIFADHMYGLGDVIGKDRNIWAEPKGGGTRRWKGRGVMLNTPLGDAALQIVRELGSIGTSIGFVVTDTPLTGADAEPYAKGGKRPVRVLHRTLMLERSITAMPCNVSCQGAMSVDEKRVDDLDGLVVKHRITRAAAVAFGLPTTPKRKFHAVTTPTGSPARIVIVDSAMLAG